MTGINVTDIFNQKLQEIQSRLPIKLAAQSKEIPFEHYLDNATATVNNNKAVNTSKASNTSTVISEDKTAQMNNIENSINYASLKYNVDANLLRAVIKQESDYNHAAISKAGAQGLMQLMPDTAKMLNVSDPLNIVQNIEGGAKFLKEQIAAFSGDVKLALAAYNAGPGSVRKYNGIPPYAETQDYVKKVMQYYTQYSTQNK